MLNDFTTHAPALLALAPRLEAELRALLDQHGVAVQFVASRVKTRESLAAKLARPERTYQRLWDVTDLVGLRVVTWFEDATAEVAQLIERTYEVDFAHSTDKQRFAEGSPFGYRSLHYVCAPRERTPAPGFRFEIQVRTALQHAWAEVEHDLGYKVDAVPPQVRRRFARIASLLEIADEEFVAIRREMETYRQAVGQAATDPGRACALDAVSLEALTQAPAARALDAQVAQVLGRELAARPFFPGYLAQLLRLTGLDTTSRVHEALTRHAADVPGFVPRYFDFSAAHLDFPATRVIAVEQGYGLLFVAWLHLLRSDGLTLGKVARAAQLFSQLDGFDERDAQGLAHAAVSELS